MSGLVGAEGFATYGTGDGVDNGGGGGQVGYQQQRSSRAQPFSPLSQTEHSSSPSSASIASFTSDRRRPRETTTSYDLAPAKRLKPSSTHEATLYTASASNRSSPAAVATVHTPTTTLSLDDTFFAEFDVFSGTGWTGIDFDTVMGLDLTGVGNASGGRGFFEGNQGIDS